MIFIVFFHRGVVIDTTFNNTKNKGKKHIEKDKTKQSHEKYCISSSNISRHISKYIGKYIEEISIKNSEKEISNRF